MAQTPNTKLQTPEKLQAPNCKLQRVGRGLELGTWDFFGGWSLVFGFSISGFPWSFELEIWSFRRRSNDSTI